MVQCCVPLCSNRSDCQNWRKSAYANNNRKISFYRLENRMLFCLKKLFKIIIIFIIRLPKDETIRKVWINILDLPPNISNAARICSDHFKKESFVGCETNTRIKPNALPFRTQDGRTTEEEKEESIIACCNLTNYLI